MRATLTFTLPDEQVEHQNAVDAGKAFSLLNHIVTRMREREKYGLNEDETDALFIESLQGDILDAFPDIWER